MILAIDTDGTLEISKGPVPLSLVRMIATRFPVYAIGNQSCLAFLEIRTPYRNTGIPLGHKSRALRWIQEQHPLDETRWVVDDTPAQYAEGWEGWEFFSPADFVLAAGVAFSIGTRAAVDVGASLIHQIMQRAREAQERRGDPPG